VTIDLTRAGGSLSKARVRTVWHPTNYRIFLSEVTKERIQGLTAQLLRAENPDVAEIVAVELRTAIAQYLAVVRVKFGDYSPESAEAFPPNA